MVMLCDQLDGCCFLCRTAVVYDITSYNQPSQLGIQEQKIYTHENFTEAHYYITKYQGVTLL